MTITDVLNNNYLFFSKNFVYSAKPVTTLKKFIDEKGKIRFEDKIVMIFDNTVYEMNSFTTTDKFIDELKKFIALDYEEQYVQKIKLFLGIAEMILQKEKMEILYNNRIYPLFMENMLYLCKEILPYTIKFKGVKYDFTGCTIYVKMKDVNYYSKPGIMGNKYRHPHVYADNTICLGDYELKYSFEGAVEALNQSEQILVSGHYWAGEIPDVRLNLSNYPNRKGGFV